MPGTGGGRKAKQQAKKTKAKRGSGNPAKRANQAASAPQQAEPGQLPAAFGGGPGAGDDFELPAELKDLLGKQK
jgi:signal recognition particle subunit SRP54